MAFQHSALSTCRMVWGDAPLIYHKSEKSQFVKTKEKIYNKGGELITSIYNLSLMIQVQGKYTFHYFTKAAKCAIYRLK